MDSHEDFVKSEEAHANEDKDIENEELRHFETIVNCFQQYRNYSRATLKREWECFSELPLHHKTLLHKNFVKHAQTKYECIDFNQKLLDEIVQGIGDIFDNTANLTQNRQNGKPEESFASEFNMNKLHSTLKQIVRDWSHEGILERKQAYDPVLQALQKYFPAGEKTLRKDRKVLVPGAGLARLVFEIVSLGFSCDGNEFSLFMLFCSNFMLNRCLQINSGKLYPFIHETTNNLTFDDVIRPVNFPDVTIDEKITADSTFSMLAGDFLEVFKGEENSYDSIVTVFFMDTARNIAAYIEQIKKLLKPGGIWINLGPLLYHFADLKNETSIELPYSEVRRLISFFGFDFLEEDTNVVCNYSHNIKSMLKFEYKCVYFVCKNIQDNIDR